MRKLAIGILAAMFLGGCYSQETAARLARREDSKEANKTRPSITERIDGEHENYIAKFETEFSDGTRVGCVTHGYGVSCVALKGPL